MCGAEALLIAVKLASGIIGPLEDYVAVYTIPAVCGCECASTESARLRCQAARLDAESERIAQRNAQVQEFRDIVKMCRWEKK